MKLIHLADLHIGKSLDHFDLIEDQRRILEQILLIADAEKADAVLIAGDVYDKSVPGEEAVRLFDDFLCKLAARRIAAFLISGNHDSDARLQFGSTLFRTSGIYICAEFSGLPGHYQLEDAYGPVHFYLLPFIKASQVRHFYPDAQIETYEDAVRTVLAEARPDPAARNVLVAHQFVAGKGSDPALGGSESAAVQHVGLVEKIGADCFADFDYTALGHIHSAQAVGSPTVCYAGSPLKYSRSEASHEKSVTVITLGEKGQTEVRRVPLCPFRDLRHIRGTMAQLLAPEHITDPQDFIYVTLTDEEPIDNAIGIFRQHYPNVVHLDYDNARTQAVIQPVLSGETAWKPFGEIVSAFYEKIYGCGISEEEMQILRAAAREAGVSDEAD